MPDVLWTPDEKTVEAARLTRYRRWLNTRRGLDLGSYGDLHRWSVDHLEDFWASLWEYFEVAGEGPGEEILTTHDMPGARWFTGARLNYAENALRRRGDELAIVGRSQTRPGLDLSWEALYDAVARARAGLRALGIGRGDRVAALLPNIPEAIVAYLATASLGAIWSSCSPEFGARSVNDRLGQIQPKLLLCVDGYRWRDRAFDRRDAVAELCAALPGLEHLVTVPYLDPGAEAVQAGPRATLWADLLAHGAEPGFERVPFDHPLEILFSSGTTGLPKAIVHSHGGVTLEHLKQLALHQDMGPQDRYLQITTTAWMMWNLFVSGLLVGATLLCFDGDPGYPGPGGVWLQASELGATILGTSAAYLTACRKAGLHPARDHDLSALREVTSTGSTLTAEVARWIYQELPPGVLVSSISGGTDVCSAFVGGVPVLPVVAGEMAAPYLGVAAAAFDPEGHPVIGKQGELVITEPMPSMPVGFWGDPDGERYRASYFDVYPGIWRHGDWITFTERGSCIISGRSDATLNRGGVRIGSAELYAVVDDFPEVVESLVVHLDDPGGGAGRLVLFVALAPGGELDPDLVGRIKAAIRHDLSPRHVPDEVHVLPAIPKTLTGKKLEVPIKRILLGEAPESVASAGAITGIDGLQAVAKLASHPK
ncbi:MAG: acetoacetate--CoA ligase [Candidatus Dormibacteraeota bacterium]|nr:acetoacetate--CoA ligase [Candidatus Dormibacteraeota bacterium]